MKTTTKILIGNIFAFLLSFCFMVSTTAMFWEDHKYGYLSVVIIMIMTIISPIMSRLYDKKEDEEL